MITPKSLVPTLYELSVAFDRISDEEHARIDPNEVWRDLWTNINQYDTDFKVLNSGWSIAGILNLGDLVKNPVLPKPIIMFGWFDLLIKTEFPTNSARWIIVSQHLLSVMCKFISQPKLQQVRVIDRAQFSNVYSENIRQYEDDKLISQLHYLDDWFYGVQLEEFSVIDENWDSEDTKNIPWKTLTVNPPAFFVDPKSPGQILVTSEGRSALESEGIRGIRFIEPFSI
jgi:predicted XRE-type DNA-binding protein